ncbi:uncharacterized protein LOC110377758, partial [Helicoverpa armigera]|uniref:uncharacterized protein LOC110377758 n=1 Tax=Helicoverpa armigera TaxID=29058 RepID=UPI003083C6BE
SLRISTSCVNCVVIFLFILHSRRGMPSDCRDCLGIRYRINTLHQTWKWLHQTIALHEYLISLSSADTDAGCSMH